MEGFAFQTEPALAKGQEFSPEEEPAGMHETGPEAKPRILLVCREPGGLTDREDQLVQAGWMPIRVANDQAVETALASGQTDLVVICDSPVGGIGPS